MHDLVERQARAAAGDSDAQYELGCWWHNGAEVADRDVSEAERWLLLAAAQGHGGACRRLGCIWVDERDQRDVGIGWFERGAALGDVACVLNLGVVYAKDTVSSSSMQLAIDCFQRAAALGENVSLDLGWLFLHRGRSPLENVRGAELLREASVGRYLAVHRLLRQRGETLVPLVTFERIRDGAEFSFTPRKSLFMHGASSEEMFQAARAGKAEAQCDIATLWWFEAFPSADSPPGHLHPESLTRAVGWFEMSADNGCSHAAFALGCIYCSKPGFISLRRAVPLFELAARDGIDEARDALSWLDANAEVWVEVG